MLLAENPPGVTCMPPKCSDFARHALPQAITHWPHVHPPSAAAQCIANITNSDPLYCPMCTHRLADGVQYIVHGAHEGQPLLIGARQAAAVEGHPGADAVACQAWHLQAIVGEGGQLAAHVAG